MYQFIRPLLFSLSPECSHHLTLKGLSLLNKVGLGSAPEIQANEAVTVMGIKFPNRVGLAAGLDKNADTLDGLAAMGFGFVEVGTVTPLPQAGNPLPRLFRLTEQNAIINRMGFNNKGVDYLVEQVKKSKANCIIGINIGKNKDTTAEDAAEDYLICLRKAYAHADYITINISSPNTPGLRDLQYGDELTALLSCLKAEQKDLAKQYDRYVPLTVKVAPDLDDEAIKQIAQTLLDTEIDGLIATNTTLSREAVQNSPHADEQGGLSGQPLTKKSTEVIAKFSQHLQGKVPIIGVGGIASAADAQDKLVAGAALVQVYSALIYQGQGLVTKIRQGIS
ncbi:MAG: quinone-dependent dihydroorotate dehydrogenase [Thiotrichaceae bacterium]|nr:quinone-dependent dihydroorotate dehydrogenase [Thiotrichaceae bacterium]